MKYLKKFENSESPNYKVGDYILLKDDENKWVIDIEVKIIEILGGYKISSFYPNGNIARIWVDETEIDRKMTTREIKDYKIRKEAEKYNL